MQCLFEKCNEKRLHHLKKKRGEARVLYYRLLGALLQHHHCHLYCPSMGAAYRGRVLQAQLLSHSVNTKLGYRQYFWQQLKLVSRIQSCYNSKSYRLTASQVHQLTKQ